MTSTYESMYLRPVVGEKIEDFFQLTGWWNWNTLHSNSNYGESEGGDPQNPSIYIQEFHKSWVKFPLEYNG